MERIYVDNGLIKQIAEDMGCNYMTVSNALRGTRKETNELQKRIRKAAIEQYGGRTRKRVAPKWGCRIQVPHGVITAIAMRYDYAPVTVRKALRGYENSVEAKRIREIAMREYGGLRVENDGQLIDRTRFFGSMMIQYFANGITIEADRESGLVRMYRGKTLLECVTDPTIEALMEMQERAMKIAADN